MFFRVSSTRSKSEHAFVPQSSPGRTAHGLDCHCQRFPNGTYLPAINSHCRLHIVCLRVCVCVCIVMLAYMFIYLYMFAMNVRVLVANGETFALAPGFWICPVLVRRADEIFHLQTLVNNRLCEIYASA